MDTFNFLVAMLFILLAIQYNQNWIVFGIIVITLVSTRSVTTFLAALIGTGIIYFFARSGNIQSYIPHIIIVILILGLLLGIGKKEQQPEYYLPDYGGYGGF